MLGAAGAFAQPPSEDEIWGYTTTATGTDVFDTLAAAEEALSAGNESLVRVGEPRVSDDEIRIVYRSETELPPSGGVVWHACNILDCEYSVSSYDEGIAPLVFLRDQTPSSTFCPAVEVSDWEPHAVVNGVVVSATEFWTFSNPCDLWYKGPFATYHVRWEGVGAVCSLGTWDAAAGVCRIEALEEISSRRLTEPDCSPIGNPCYASTGNKHERYIDYQAPGITFERYYNSRYANYSNPNDQPLGRGWTHNYASRIVINDDEPAGLYRPDGGLLALTSIGTDRWAATNGSQLQLRDDGDALRVYLPSGATESYDEDGRLSSLTDPAGRTSTVTYGSGDRLESVTGPFGHQLVFHWTLATGSSAVYVIDYLEDPAGDDITYDVVDGLLEAVEYQDGTTLGYLYENSEFPDLLTGVLDENEDRYKTFGYDSRGRATLTEHAGGFRRWTLEYNADNTVTATDANSVISEYAFQPGVGNGRVLGTVERSGIPTERVNEASGQQRLLSETDQRGVQTVYQYDTYHLTSRTEAFGTPEARTTSFGYLNDTSQLTTAVQRPSACGTGLFQTLSTAYLPGTQLVQQSGELGYANESGTCQSISRATTFEYGAAGSFTRTKGLVTAIRGPRAGVADDVTLAYYECTAGDGCGQLATVTNAAGHVWTFDTYNSHGLVTQMTQPNGVVVTYGYDLRRRVQTVTETASGLPPRTTTYDYYDNGLIKRVTDPTGAFIESAYNDAHLPTEIRDNAGNRIEYGYDLAGNRTSETIRDPAGSISSTRSMAYDDFNRFDTVSLPNPAGGSDVWDYDFDAAGLLESETSPEGRTTTYDDYDELRRLRSFVNALGQRTTYSYDALDNLASVTALTTPSYPAGVVTSYVHDDFGRQVKETSADGGVLLHTYDQADNLLLTVDARGLSTDYVYDALNRLTTIEVEPQGGGVRETMSIVYDDLTAGGARGQVVAASSLNGLLTYAYSYDPFGRQTSEQLSYTGLNTPVLTQYTYDAADRLEEIRRGTPTQPNLWVTRNARDAAGLITDIEDRRGTPVDIVGGVQHAPFGPYRAMTFGNGLALTRTLDQRYRLSSAAIPNTESRTLTWTPDDNLSVEDVSTALPYGPSTHRFEFVYDDLDRVLSINWPAGTEHVERAYAYDSNGQHGSRTNMSVVHNGQFLQNIDFSYAAGTHRLAGLQSNGGAVQPIQADASGNVVGGSTSVTVLLDFQYDSLGQARTARYPNTPLSLARGRYDFNPFGERVHKEIFGGEFHTLFTYLPDGKLLGETVFRSGVLVEQRDYVWMGDTPVAMHAHTVEFWGGGTADETYYLHVDHLNAPERATNAAGELVWSFEKFFNSPFGEGYVSNWNSGTIAPINLRLPGQYFDAETHTTHYNYYRQYWPFAGGYVQSDPIGLEGGLNPYRYAEGNPLRYTDPTGSIVPLAVAAGVGYARCVASCAAIDAAIAYLSGDACATLAGIGGNCALGCLNPLNWIKVNRLGILAKSASAARGGLVIGRGADLAKPGALRAGEYSLKWESKLPNFKAEWHENAGRLREAMRQGNPIRDISPGDTGGIFLNAERALLRDRGWTFNSPTGYWMPPGP
jgi:RHS repeat-associated protein